MKTEYDKVSIIICVYNEEKNIEYVIRKCNECIPEAEIVVVNDGSSDNSDTIISKLCTEIKINYIIIPKNKGKSNAMVTGVENAKNEIILFFDADITGIRKNHFE